MSEWFPENPGVLYLLEGSEGLAALLWRGAVTLQKFELEKRKIDKVLDAITARYLRTAKKCSINRDGLVHRRDFRACSPGQGMLKLDEMEMRVDPRRMESDVQRSVAHTARLHL